MDNTQLKYKDNIPFNDKLKRKLWSLEYVILFRPFSGRLFNYWRIFILKILES